MIAVYPTPEQTEILLTAPDDKPVVMVNLLCFKAEADAPDEGLSGEQAYQLYVRDMVQMINDYGGQVLWVGQVDSYFIGEMDDPIDLVAMVKYPSRTAFLQMIQDEKTLAASVHRTAGLKGQWLIATTEIESALAQG